MVISCSAYGCSNKWSKQTTIHFHKFPLKCKTLCDKWVSALKRKDFSPTAASIVCSDHFKSTDYIRKPGGGKRFLKKNAVPSKFNFPSIDNLSIDLPLDASTLTNLAEGISRRKKKGKRLIEQKRNSRKLEYYSDISCSLVREMESDEIINVRRSNLVVDATLITEQYSRTADSVEEDSELMNIDEEDKCYILGSIWGERLKLLPSSVRPFVRRKIDNIFEEARTAKLTDQ